MSEKGVDPMTSTAKNLAPIILVDLSKALAWLAAGILTLSYVLKDGAQRLEP